MGEEKTLIVRILLACLLIGNTQAYATGLDQNEWDHLLKQHVIVLHGGQATRVDYAGLVADQAHLRHYLQATSQVTTQEFDHWTRSDQLAFLINAYNAWTLDLVLTGYPRLASIKDLGNWLESPWKRHFIPLLGETRSLDDIEQGLIRGSGRYEDPRIHFAVNCASIGCPALRPEAYAGPRLDSQLDDQARLFLEDRSRNRLVGEALWISPIFKWYRSDFEKGWRGTRSLEEFLARYAPALGLTSDQAQRFATADISVRYSDYDWRLNAAGR